ncbi:MAG: DUF2339 domain-containing protein [Desulfobacteraceae bacterium]|nr:DUF2339 domain-containing protein [Desulfobacteraceae bacterium]
MYFLLLLLAVVLYILILRSERRLGRRIDRLESSIEYLRKRMQPGASPQPQAESEAAATEPETGPEAAMAAPEHFFPYTQVHPAKEEEIPVEPPMSVEQVLDIEPQPESLEDLVLSAEPAEAVQEQQTTTFTAAPEEKKPESQPTAPSQWQERWRAFKATVDWEQFTGVKLFAWLGGVALFIAAGFFVKFSIERNLIPPALRLAISALIGLALIIGSFRFGEEKYRVMRHTLAAAGIGVLYSVVFAATLYYTYLTHALGFGLLVLISITAFVLALFHKSRAVAVLGAIGAYATPVLVPTGQESLVLLFVYLSIVNIGLYLVARRLLSQVLILVAAAGTVASLGLGTERVFDAARSLTMALIWILNPALFTYFLAAGEADPRQNQAARYAGIFIFISALVVAVALLLEPGWPPLLVVTATQALAVTLAWRQSGWYGYVIAYGAVSFLVALAWVLFAFEPNHFSAGFPLLLLYGAFGGLGPLLLVWKNGVNRAVITWFKIFPLAVVLVSLAIVFQQPVVSFWFWPLLLGLELLGIGLSLLFRAFVQVAVLVLLFLVGALHWLFNVPAEVLGLGFFVFIIGAGVILCAAVFVLIRRLPDLVTALNLAGESSTPPTSVTATGLTQWLAAAPAAGVCVLLAASFLIKYPHYPQPGMVTIVCFLALVLAAARRFGFEISGVAALVGAVAAQAVFVLHPYLGPPVYFQAQLWAGALFLAALAAPFLFFSSTERWPRIWYGWALFEAIQASFLLFVTQRCWHGPEVKWVPLVLAILKLPAVAVLLPRLEGRPERNAILAFHGGVLLFYLSTQPVLVLDYGWIGPTFVFEAAALLWLNRRIEHPGLRWVALLMAPAGLLILFFHLPVLKSPQSLPILNSAVLSTAAAVAALALAVGPAGYPRRRLAALDLPNTFLWLAVVTGFVLVNLVVADLFARPGTAFTIWPGSNFVQGACYGLAWVALGGLLRRLTGLPGAVRLVGLGLVAAGTLGLIVLPLMLPETAVAMRPVFNTAFALYLPLLAGLYYLFHKESWEEGGGLIKNILLALFLAGALITFKFQKGLAVAPGYAFSLLTSKTATLAASSAAGWLIYGLGLLLWPRRLDRPFRLAGVVLILLALFKALSLPFTFPVAFAQMTPLLNGPSLIFACCLAALVYLTVHRWEARPWPVARVAPRLFWGILLAVMVFAVLSIEVASVFAIKGRSFSMMTHGSLAMQLAYSIGWLLYAIGLMVVGIRWKSRGVRWAAIIAIVLTAIKIFILDVRSLGSLYRVGSFVGLAVVLMGVSFLYQRFLSEGNHDAR